MDNTGRALSLSPPLPSPPRSSASSHCRPNHGRKWTHDDDRQIAEAPNADEEQLAIALGRSTHAVQSRRAMLAARLHAASGRTIEECAKELGASVEKTKAAAEGGGAKESSAATGKRRTKSVTMEEKEPTISDRERESLHACFPPLHHHDHQLKIHTQRQTAMARAPSVVSSILRPTPPLKPATSAIGVICSFIKRNAGGGGGGHATMTDLWAQDALVPTLVQYHAGFQAYAAYVNRAQPSVRI